MNLKLFFYNLTLLFLLTSCSKTNPDHGDPDFIDGSSDDTLKFEVVWQKTIGTDTFPSWGRELFVKNGKIIYTWNFAPLPNWPVMSRDLLTGELVWKWDDYHYGSNEISDMEVVGNKVAVVGSHVNFQIVDIDSGLTDWSTTIERGSGNGYPRMGSFDSYLFHQHQIYNVSQRESHLVMAELDKPRWDTIYSVSIQDVEGFVPDFQMPAGWISENLDTILIFQNRMFNHDNNSSKSGRIDLHAYNLTADSLLWEVLDFDFDENSNVKPALIFEDKVYFQGARTVYCFNVKNGDLIWKERFGGNEQFMFSNLLVINDKLIAYSDHGNMFAFDSGDGSILWRLENCGNGTDLMVHHNDIIYYNGYNGKLYAVDAGTGDLLLAEKSPNNHYNEDCHHSGSGIAIAPDLGYLYTSDGYFIMCIKLIQ